MAFSHAAAGQMLLVLVTFRQKPSARQAGEVQCLGEMPWISRATAIEPDAVNVMKVVAYVNPAIA